MDHDADAETPGEEKKSGNAQLLGTLKLGALQVPLVIATPNSSIWDHWPGRVYEVDSLNQNDVGWRSVEKLLKASGDYVAQPYPFPEP